LVFSAPYAVPNTVVRVMDRHRFRSRGCRQGALVRCQAPGNSKDIEYPRRSCASHL
jgi:hypothetical protein